MGLFKFIKSKGKELLEEKDRLAELAISKEVQDLGLGDDVQVAVKGDKVTLSGKATDQETKEKIILAAGNVTGIAEVSDEMKTGKSGDAAVFYTVESGDSLSKIAKAHYGDAMRYPEIFEANKPMLTHPDKIYPGQVLRIPGATAQA